MTESLERPRRKPVSSMLMLIWVLTVRCLMSSPGRAGEPADLAREVQSILADKCFDCHGPDPSTRKAKLRLDRPEDALGDRGGYAAFVAGKPDESEALLRMSSVDDLDRMPPPKSARQLSEGQVASIRRWIEQGAPWETHWSLVPPVRPELPALGDARSGEPTWIRNAIDSFVLSRLRREGLEPSPEASRTRLIRRLSFDLIGLPPTPAEVDSFVKDAGNDAYERVVDRLLGSEHFGERLASEWLDAARYSDTDGFQLDETRTNWPWRDWVIRAFNRNMPFDRFTIEQFAGDLLPDATPEQVLATCFHRNHMTNGEGGRDPEESRIDYVLDRVNTMGTVWLGLTLGCTQCHSHKFDPITQTEYYQLSAFFNSIDEDGKAGRNARPFLSYPSTWGGPVLVAADAELRRREAALEQVRASAEAAFPKWLAEKTEQVNAPGAAKSWRTIRATGLSTLNGTTLAQDDEGVIRATGPNPRHEDYRIVVATPLRRVTGLRLDVLPHESHTNGGLSRSEAGHFILTNLKVSLRRRGGKLSRDVAIASAVADFSADPKKNAGYGAVADLLDDDPRNGWATHGGDPTRAHSAVFAFDDAIEVTPEEEFVVEMRHRSNNGQHNIGRFVLAMTDQLGSILHGVEVPPLDQLAALPAEDRDDLPGPLRARLLDQFLAERADVSRVRAAVDRARQHRDEIKKATGPVDVMVLRERAQARPSHLLVRGVWDNKGPQVAPGVPGALSSWPVGEPRNRLGLAYWLVDRRNPLTARVAVNRLWQMLFGAGLVRTPEDFGVQGERPTHPELLDWLAVEFMEDGWDVKRLLRRIVTSATYRQNSDVTPVLRAKDPENRMLARGARFRLPSAMIHDMALRASDLLDPSLGGPPVRPYQPEGIWEETSMGRFHYEPSEGGDRYRRTIYAFWRRSVMPTFLFDSAQRRVCEVQMTRTNTPLQALTLLNERTMIEASIAMARRAIAAGSTPEERIGDLCRRVLSRPPDAREQAILESQWNRAIDSYRRHPDDATTLVAQAHAAWELSPSSLAPSVAVELASYAVIASTILNMDEAITHE